MKIRKLFKTVIFLCLIVMIMMGLSGLFVDKTSRYYKSEFLNARTDFDALFLGASRMHEAVDPMYLWEKYGISSYNLASAGESVQMSYYVLKEALDRCSPRVVFIDAAKISDESDKINSGYGFVHESIDALPLNRNKLEAVNYAGRFFEGGRLGFISMLYAYHGRYDDLKEEDFKREVNYDKGAYIMTSVYKREKPVRQTDEVKELKGGDGVSYYKRILELCREKGVRCVLTDIPVHAKIFSPGRQKHLNALIKLTKENGGDVISFNDILDEIKLDYDYDFGDAGHLNFMGAGKVCDYLAGYMQDDIGIEDHRNDPLYSIPWEEDKKKWKEQRTGMLDEKEDAVAYIFGAVDEGREIKMYVYEPDKVRNQYGMDFCLNRTGIEPEPVDEDEIGGYDMKIEVLNKENGERIAQKSFFYNQSSGMFTTKEEE
ncbi:MAG: hypothetical protein IJU87_08705 [Lachnospiraceae bacterium]|nr:hypothetical protein [Lachnospiraceae bacterium]